MFILLFVGIEMKMLCLMFNRFLFHIEPNIVCSTKYIYIELVVSRLSGVALKGGRWLIKMVDATNLAKVFHIFRLKSKLNRSLIRSLFSDSDNENAERQIWQNCWQRWFSWYLFLLLLSNVCSSFHGNIFLSIFRLCFVSFRFFFEYVHL